MHYRIIHTTEYIYADQVSHCYNLAHIIPRDSLRQRRIKSNVRVQPFATYSSKRVDYYGNMAYHFEIQKPHNKLVITSTSEVDTEQQHSELSLDLGITCADARRLLKADTSANTLMAREFLYDSPLIKHGAALRDYAAPSFAENNTLLSCVMDLTRRIYAEFKYSPESTTVATPLDEVLQTRKGVCQDFAHLQIGCLRAMGFPAKYVSGYIETLPPPGQVKLVGSDASHAWLSVYSPSEGWFEFDPTNNCIAGEQHILTAWGRDYSDVTPLRGVLFGGGKKPILNISVDVARAK